MSREILEELIIEVSEISGISEEILEKDYYVCLILKDLSRKQRENNLPAYFKGGTALYKILDKMVRFSEDIDLTVRVDKEESTNFNRKRLKDAAYGYNIDGLILIEEQRKIDKDSIISFFEYDSLFSLSALFKAGKIQIEATSFTVSEPISKYTIEPLIYKYASEEQKQILKDIYDISDFEIEIVKLERIFMDKIFAAEHYYLNDQYYDVAKHIYDLNILMKEEVIKKFLNNKQELEKIIAYEREEENLRYGGIKSNVEIKDFHYLNNEFNISLIRAFNQMQDTYVLDESSKFTINEIKETLEVIKNIFTELQVH